MVVVHGLNLLGQGGVAIPPDVMQPGISIQKVHVDQLGSKGPEPVPESLTRRAGGNVVHHHLQAGVSHLPVHPAGPLQVADQVALVVPEGLHDQCHSTGLGHLTQPAQVIPAAVPHGGLVLSLVAPTGVHHHPVGPQLGGQMDGVGKISKGVLQVGGLLGGILVLVGNAGGGDRHHPHAVGPQLGPEGRDIVIAGVIQPEVGGAAPQLNLPDTQALLAIQEEVHGKAAVVLVHVDQLTAFDASHSAPPLRTSRARSSGQEGRPA